MDSLSLQPQIEFQDMSEKLKIGRSRDPSLTRKTFFFSPDVILITFYDTHCVYRIHLIPDNIYLVCDYPAQCVRPPVS